MTTHDNEERRSARTAVDLVIFASLDRDPGEVARALEEVIKRCKAEGRHSVDQIDAAAAQLRRELGLPGK